MAAYFHRKEDGWTDVVEVPPGWIRAERSDEQLLSALGAPMPKRRWRARVVYMTGSRGYRTVNRVVEGEAAGRTQAIEQISRLYNDRRGFYIAELFEVVEPIPEESCRATVTI